MSILVNKFSRDFGFGNKKKEIKNEWREISGFLGFSLTIFSIDVKNNI